MNLSRLRLSSFFVLTLVTTGSAMARPGPLDPLALDPQSALHQRLAASTLEDLFEVVFDRGEPGIIRALGRSYKAQFDREGATFYPVLGEKAEHHEPLQFRLAEVACGGRPLEFSRDVEPRLDEAQRTVSFDRGSLVESYALEQGSMEQLFRFDSMPAPGALEIRVDVAAEHLVSTAASKLEFRGRHSRVEYSKAIAVDATGQRTKLRTEWTGDGIVIEIDAATMAEAAFPLTVDPVVRNFTVANSSSQEAFPDVALEMGSYQYLVVWERTVTSNDHDVLAAFFDRDLNPIAGVVPIETGSTNARYPRVASNYSAGTFFVAMVAVGTSTSSIFGRAVIPFSTTPGPIVQISNSGESPTSVDVGGDFADESGTLYCVAYDRGGPIRINMVDATGTTVVSGVGATLVLANTLVRPQVSKSAGSRGDGRFWTVTVQQQGSPTSVHAIRMKADGLPEQGVMDIAVDGTTRRLASASTVLEYGGRPYTVVSHEKPTSTGSEVSLSLLDRDLQPDMRTMADLDGAPLNRARYNADVASDGENIVVAYQESTAGGDTDIYVSSFRVENDRFVLVEGRVRAAGTSAVEGTPQVLAARDGGGSHGRFPIVYASFGNGDVLGVQYDVPVRNDRCDQALDLGEDQIRGTLVGATLDTLPSCGFVNSDPVDVWYRLTPFTSGEAYVSTCGTADLIGAGMGASTVLSVYEEASCPANPLAETCSDDSQPDNCDIHGDDVILRFDVVAGSEYLLRVGTKSLVRPEDFTLEFNVGQRVFTPFCVCTFEAPCGNTTSEAGCLNSTGRGALLEGSGSASISNGDLVMISRDLPANAAGILFAGSGQAHAPFYDGLRCMSGPFTRFKVRFANSAGVAIESGQSGQTIAERVGAQPGQTSRFQWWYRDAMGPCGSGANTSSGLALTWEP